MAKLIGCFASDPVKAGQFFRVAFAPVLPTWATSAEKDDADYRAIYKDVGAGRIPRVAFLSPFAIAANPGEPAVIAFATYTPNPAATVGDMAGALNSAKLAITVVSIERVDSRAELTPDKLDAAARQAANDKQQQSLIEQFIALLEKLGIGLAIAVTIVLAVLAFKWAKELAPA